MSAICRPVGGLARTMLSILKISSRRRYLIRSPVNGEVSGRFTWWLGAGDGEFAGADRLGAGEWFPVSTTATAARIASAIAELAAAISVRRVGRAGDFKGLRLPPQARTKPC
jgi:hypothetical protein